MREVELVRIVARPRGEKFDVDLQVNGGFDQLLAGKEKLLIRAAAEKLVRLVAAAAVRQIGIEGSKVTTSGWQYK